MIAGVKTMIFVEIGYILLLSILQSAVLFLPGYLSMFQGPGFSAAIFTIALFSAHWAIFVSGIRPQTPLIALPVVFVVQWVVLTFAYSAPDWVTLNLYGGDSMAYQGFTDMGYGGLYRTMIIQTLISMVVSVGLWMGVKHARFVIRKAGKDLEEQERVFQFRNRFHTEEPPPFYRYRSLMKWGQTFLGVKKNRIVSMISALRLDDTLFLYDLHIDPEWDDPDLPLKMIHSASVRPEILTSNIKDVALVLPTGQNGSLNLYAKLGFEKPSEADRNRLEKLMQMDFTDRFEGWLPFGEHRELLYAWIPENAGHPTGS